MDGRVIAITGASSGIGEATARRLAAGGARVVIGARRMERLNGIADEIAAAGGVVLAQELDVTCRKSMEQFVDKAIARFDRLDVFIANAGVMMLAPFAEARTEDWDRMLDVNVKGVLNGIASALPHMQDRKSGHMVFIGSTSGHRVSPLGGVYSATKFAVRAIADSLRLEGGPGIRSTLISPSATQTEIVDHVGHPEMTRNLLSIRHRILHPDAVAQAIEFAVTQPDNVDVSEIIVRPTTVKD